MNTLVSVIIPTFNREKFVAETLQSVLKQTYSPIEIIVADNGSTDSTLEVLESFRDQITLVHEPKSGMGGSFARNAGLEQATGNYVAFLDSDDLWMATKIEKQVKFLETNPNYSWCYTDLIGFDSDTGRHLYQYSQTRTMHTGDVLEQAFIQIFTPLSTLLIRKDLMDRVGRFWPTLKGTDADLAIRLAAESPVGFVPEVLAHYRVHNDSVTGHINGGAAQQAAINLIEKAVQAYPDRLTSLENKAKAASFTSIALKFLQAGQTADARKHIKKAMAETPFTPQLYLLLAGTFMNPAQLKKVRQLRSSFRTNNISPSIQEGEK